MSSRPVRFKFGGGDGSSIEQAISISDVQNNFEGIEYEYQYINALYGVCNQHWKFLTQSLLSDKNGRYYDRINIYVFREKECKSLYFDTTDFFFNNPLADEFLSGLLKK